MSVTAITPTELLPGQPNQTKEKSEYRNIRVYKNTKMQDRYEIVRDRHSHKKQKTKDKAKKVTQQPQDKTNNKV